MRLISTLLTIAAVCVGCATATVGTDFNSGAVSRLRPGVTTLGQASAMFGRAPNSSIVGADAYAQHTWSFIQSTATAGLFNTTIETSTKAVTLQFAPNGVMVKTLLLSGMTTPPMSRELMVPEVGVQATPNAVGFASPVRLGRDAWQAERAARIAGCGGTGQATMTASTPGSETYNVSCNGGDVMVVRCEMGNCRVLQ